MGQLGGSILEMLYIGIVYGICTLYYYLMGYVLFDKYPGWKGYIKIIALVALFGMVSGALGGDTAYALFTNILGVLVLCVIGYGLQWGQLLKGFAYATSTISALVVISYLLVLSFFTEEQIEASKIIGSTEFYILNLSTIITGMLELFVIHSLKQLFRRNVRIVKPLIYIMRPLILLTVSVVVILFTAQRIQRQLRGVDLLIEMIGNYVLVALLAGAAFSYLMQDIRAYKLYASNKTLQRRQEMYDELLEEAREFRHNIGNTLYGLEGTILSGDIDEIKRYYSQLVDTCAIINNDNIAQLNNMPNHAVRALILNKIKHAYSRGIPFYVVVDDGLVWRGLGNREMCEVLGVLIDNSIEAAHKSQTPMLSMDFGNFDGCMEVIIRNTFSGCEDDLAFLQGCNIGIGLSSAKRVLSGYEGALFNQLQRGRHIETILSF